MKSKVQKCVVMVVMICLAIISVSFKVTETAYANEPTAVSEPIYVGEPTVSVSDNQETEMVYAIPVKKNVISTELVTIPEIEVSEVESKIAKTKLEEIKENLNLYYTDDEILYTTLIVQAEDLVAHSQTIWSAHAWVILGRVGAPGFGADSIIEVLSKPGQFSTWCTKCLVAEPNPEVEEIVRDVFARKILEDLGFSEREVGRTVPATHLFFDNRDGDLYNEFYRFCWGDVYNPFSAPYNPYDN